MQSSGNVGDDAHIVPLRGEPPAEWGNVVFALFHSTYRVVSWGGGSMEGIDPYIETIVACRCSLNGTQSSGNVGDDAHIVPLRGEPPAEWEMSFFLFHSTYRFDSVGFGSMKGIDPYIETIGACH